MYAAFSRVFECISNCRLFFWDRQRFFMASSLCHSLILVYFHGSFSYVIIADALSYLRKFVMHPSFLFREIKLFSPFCWQSNASYLPFYYVLLQCCLHIVLYLITIMMSYKLCIIVTSTMMTTMILIIIF